MRSARGAGRRLERRVDIRILGIEVGVVATRLEERFAARACGQPRLLDAALMRRAPRQPPRHHGAGRQRPVGEDAGGEPQAADGDAFVVFVLVVLLQLAAPLGFSAGRSHFRRPAQAGRPEEPQRKAAEDDAERGIGAARKLVAGEPFGHAEGKVAGGAAEAGRERPAGEHRQAGKCCRQHQAAADPGERLADRAARPIEMEEAPAADGEGQDEPHHGQPEELHGEIGEDGARPPEEVGDRRVGRVAEARIVDVPGDEAGEERGGQGHDGKPRGAQPVAGEKIPQAAFGGRIMTDGTIAHGSGRRTDNWLAATLSGGGLRRH